MTGLHSRQRQGMQRKSQRRGKESWDPRCRRPAACSLSSETHTITHKLYRERSLLPPSPSPLPTTIQRQCTAHPPTTSFSTRCPALKPSNHLERVVSRLQLQHVTRHGRHQLCYCSSREGHGGAVPGPHCRAHCSISRGWDPSSLRCRHPSIAWWQACEPSSQRGPQASGQTEASFGSTFRLCERLYRGEGDAPKDKF